VARLLFAAHDPGGAQMIGAPVPELLRRGHEVDFIAAGPAVKLWRSEGREVAAIEGAADLEGAIVRKPDAVIAATGFGEVERAAWQWARRAGLRSMAAIDSWTHLLRRFEVVGGYDFPDVVAVIDTETEAAFRAEASDAVDIAVVGQPHLEAQTERLTAARGQHRFDADAPMVVFFSEPIIEDFGARARGFDQFQVFELAMRALADAAPSGLRVVVKPHPRETMERWRDSVGKAGRLGGFGVELGGETAETLLKTADGVIGMTTMVLLEAHLAHIPVLSLQPNRTGLINPIIDRAVEVVTDPAAFAARTAALISRIGSDAAVDGCFQAILDDARSRFADAVEQRLLC
jgi:hypothetical protein